MRLIVVVNQVDELGYRQTTSLLLAAAVRQEVPTWVADVEGLSVAGETAGQSGTVTVCARELPPQAVDGVAVESWSRDPDRKTEMLELGREDIVLIRTNPGRDPRSQLHAFSLDLLDLFVHQGGCVWNRPRHLSLFANKASLAMLPADYRPPMLVSQNVDALVAFVCEAPDACVIKPVVGSRGARVVKLHGKQPDLAQRIMSIVSDDLIIAQHFIPSDGGGDHRVVVLDGELIQHGEHLAGIRRTPADGDFRGNLHAGGTASPLVLNQTQVAAAQAAAQLLSDHGIRLAGIDLVGNQVIEFNVFSTGGIYDASQFAAYRFEDHILSQLLREP